jgi:RNA polymerase sigma-70 factor (ECF subfamily)
MVAVQRGDLEQLGGLFDRYQRPLFAFFVGMTANPAAAEDLVQEVFLRVLKFRHTYRPGSRFRTWVYEIARNTGYDRLRTGSREAPLDETFQPEAGDEHPVDRLVADEDARLLREALVSLPPDKREVLVLSRFQGMRYDEVAALLGCEVGAVKVRVHRALKLLRARFMELRGECRSWPVTK